MSGLPVGDRLGRRLAGRRDGSAFEAPVGSFASAPSSGSLGGGLEEAVPTRPATAPAGFFPAAPSPGPLGGGLGRRLAGRRPGAEYADDVAPAGFFPLAPSAGPLGGGLEETLPKRPGT
jgi:hypothetical protein